MDEESEANVNPPDFEQLVSDYADYLLSFEALFGLSFAEVGRYSFTEMIALVHPGITTKTSETGGLYYEVDEYWAGQLNGAAQRVPEAFAIVKDIIARNLFEGKPLPYSFRSVGFQLIRGTFKPGMRRGGPDNAGFCERWLIYEGVMYLRDVYGFTVTRNESSPENSACDVMAAVSERLNVPAQYTTIRDWCTKEKYSDFRARSQVLSNHFKDLFLRHYGVLKRPEAFGPFVELGRMRNRK